MSSIKIKSGARILGASKANQQTTRSEITNSSVDSRNSGNASSNNVTSLVKYNENEMAEDTLLLPYSSDSKAQQQVKGDDTFWDLNETQMLYCPICNEDTISLLQLNRHLDDVHSNLEFSEQDEVKKWFKTQMLKAKNFPPLAALNQRFKYLDVFDTDDSSLASSSSQHVSGHKISRSTGACTPVNPDLYVTRVHWQKPSPRDTCSIDLCGKPLTNSKISVNCRKCGKLYCEDHTLFYMKLSREAFHDPDHGVWSRVCKNCYTSRAGYNDYGASRNLFDTFTKIRRIVVDKAGFEAGRLDTRLNKLCEQLASQQMEQSKGNIFSMVPFIPPSNWKRNIEQSIILWEDDSKVSRCPQCNREFNGYTFRKHHCRLCGRVVCGETSTECSKLVTHRVNLTDSLTSTVYSGETNGNTSDSIDVRICKQCRRILFFRRDFVQELQNKPAYKRAFEILKDFERGITFLLPKFQRLVSVIRNSQGATPSAEELTEATKVRQRLIHSFTQYNVAARRIRDLPTSSTSQKRLQIAVYNQACAFLHTNMLPLKFIPRPDTSQTPD